MDAQESPRHEDLGTFRNEKALENGRHLAAKLRSGAEKIADTMSQVDTAYERLVSNYDRIATPNLVPGFRCEIQTKNRVPVSSDSVWEVLLR